MTTTHVPLAVPGAEDAADSLSALFSPTSIAVFGASSAPEKLGSVMLAAIDRGSRGAVTTYGINPRGTAEGFSSSIADAVRSHGTAIDLAVLCIPAAATPAALQEAADAGVRAALICSGGFAEAGDDGIELQRRLRDITSETGIRLLGPNTSGFFRPGHSTVSFVPTVEHIAAGTVAVVAASGGMNHALSFLLSENGVGVGLGVGLGNSVDVTNVDVLRYLQHDDAITAVALHVESVEDGRALLSAVADVTAVKPVVAIVVGRSDVSAFSESHTGALATSWRTTRALLTEAGAVVVDDEHHLVDALAVLGRTRLPASASPGIGLVTAQAGPGLMVLDALLAGGVRVPTLSDATLSRLSDLLPPLTYQANPVDTGRPAATFADVLRATADDPDVDALAVYALAEPDAIDLADAVGTSSVHERLPVVLGIGGPREAVSAATVSAALLDLPVLSSPTSLANGVRALVEDAKLRYGRVHTEAFVPPAGPSITLPVDEARGKDLLDALGIRTPDRRVAHTREDAHRALAELEHPVAVKILDASVLHKTEIGGVHLFVRTTEELDTALDALDSIGAPAYLLETMAGSGVDLFLGVRRDSVFGPIVVAGLGGTAAEAIGDVAIRSGELTLSAATTMLDDLHTAAVLHGWRGGPRLDRNEFGRAAVALAAYVSNHDEIGDLEINPLRLTSDGLIALDAVVVGAGHTATEGDR
ncbi:acyl-CoA synthetase [Rhodococcus sp. 15-649-2-2]|uniref:acetate--CoA ligase family protein n=1 Tax=Rhodococcus sp. 15-649-2-2 TaxID=2023140 RepID=UPI000B9BEC8D|nr:acetate--CoA ligase family protein [Rhodococcus sp. 15-649-2-2]OZE74219.1 acyl-CoA synthetase [Rhodococcus sp. 15-649-2-2]